MTGTLSERWQVRAEITRAKQSPKSWELSINSLGRKLALNKIGIKKVPLCGTIAMFVSQKLTGQDEPYE